MTQKRGEDVVSETFISAFRAYGRFDPSLSSPITWLVRIAHNKAVDLVKSAAYKKTEALREETASPSSGDFADQVEDHDLLLRLYARLDWAEREFLDFRYALDIRASKPISSMKTETKSVRKNTTGVNPTDAGALHHVKEKQKITLP